MTLRSDPVLNIFKTFAALNHYNMDAVLIVSLLKDFADHIVSTAESNDINLIVKKHQNAVIFLYIRFFLIHHSQRLPQKKAITRTPLTVKSSI